MKYSILLASLLSVLSISAHAEGPKNFIKLEAIHYNVDGTPNDKNGINVQVGREVLPGIKLDIKQEARVEENTEKLSNRFETGAQYEQQIPFVKVGARGAIGDKFVNGDSFGYWLVEPFVAYDVTNVWSVKGSYRYRAAFDNSKNDDTSTYKVGVDYKYTPVVIINAALGKTTGDTEYTAFQGGVTYKF
jgi:hypothetical protein